VSEPGRDLLSGNRGGAATLMCVAGAAALIAGLVYTGTQSAIAQAQRKAEDAAMVAAVPQLADRAWRDSALSTVVGPGRTVITLGEPDLVGVRFAAPWRAHHAYNGHLSLLVASDAKGRVLWVDVLNHRETPGLGDRMERRHGDWLEQFTGRSLADPPPAAWRTRVDGGSFDALTGATVTARAVVNGVREALESAAVTGIEGATR
jgi:electron transport complex protein RnfG